MSMELLLLSLQARIVRPEVLLRYDAMLRARDYRRAAENPDQPDQPDLATAKSPTRCQRSTVVNLP